MKRVTAIAALSMISACQTTVPPEVLQQWQARTLYTCCNIRYEGGEISDANYAVGSMLPFGSQVTIEAMGKDSITFRSGVTKLSLYHTYGREQESSEQYFGRILVETDPRARFATFSKPVQEAIETGRVEVGMTKEQVIMSLGYPPTHRTASTDQPNWIYWYNRWKTYQVTFNSAGVVDNIVGRAPTKNEPMPVSPLLAPALRPR